MPFFNFSESWKKLMTIPTKILNSTSLVNIVNKKMPFTPSQHIRMISEGSHDTKDWSNDAGNSDLASQQ